MEEPTVLMAGLMVPAGEDWQNEYAWICHFNKDKKIDIVRAYLDSAAVQHLYDTCADSTESHTA